MKSSDLFVKALEKEGVKFIFALPGEENLDLIESIRKSKIKVIVTRHEQAAAFMAATYGRLTGKAGVCLSTLGPGALNLVTGFAFATLSGAPLIAITGQKGVRQNLQGQFQLIDAVSTFSPISKMATSLSAGEQIPKIVRQAFKTAQEEKPGAVHIELPEDVAKDKVKAKPLTPYKTRRPAVDKKAFEKAYRLLKESKNPLLLVGSGANRKRVSHELKHVVDNAGLFVVHTQMGKGVFSDANHSSLFTIGIHKKDYTHCGLDKADVVLTIGYDTVEYPPFVWNPKKDKKIIHIDFSPAKIEEHYNPNVELVGDIANTLCMFFEKLKKDKPKWDFSYYKKLRDILLQKYKEKTKNSSFPLKPQRIVADTRKVLSDRDMLVLDNGIYKIWVARQYPAYKSSTVLIDNALASMGQGLPNGIAAKMLYPDRNVLVYAGDGGFMMNSQEIETAVRLGLNVVCLIWRDDGYGFIRWKQKAMGFADFAMDYGNPDFVKYAQSYGIIGYRINKADDLIPTLKKAFRQKGPVVIDCPVDYSENQKVFTEELEELVCPV